MEVLKTTCVSNLLDAPNKLMNFLKQFLTRFNL